MTKKEKAAFVIDKLEELYPKTPIPLQHQDPRITSYNVCYTKLLRDAAGLESCQLVGVGQDAEFRKRRPDLIQRLKQLRDLHKVSYNFV